MEGIRAQKELLVLPPSAPQLSLSSPVEKQRLIFSNSTV